MILKLPFPDTITYDRYKVCFLYGTVCDDPFNGSIGLYGLKNSNSVECTPFIQFKASDRITANAISRSEIEITFSRCPYSNVIIMYNEPFTCNVY